MFVQYVYSLHSKQCWSIELIYAIHVAKMLHMVQLWNKKCSDARPRWCWSGPEQYQYLYASTTTSLICSGTCIGYGFRKEYSSDWPYWLYAVATTRRLHISLTSFIGLMWRNYDIDYGPVPVHAWSFREPGSAPSATDHFVWLLHLHGTVFLPASQH